MATNPFFSNYDYSNEQNLFDDLVVEMIQIYGVDTWYLTRELQAVDPIMNEDRLSIFNKAYELEMYVKTVDGFEGEGDFLSKFGLQIRDQITFSLAIRTFEQHVIRHLPTIKRPLEGDLVYMPMNKKFFEIMHVEHESVFYQNGSLQVYDLKCELFEYSNERFETGVPFIDQHYNRYVTDSAVTLQQLEQQNVKSRNLVYEEEEADFVDFSQIDPFTEVIDTPADYITVDDVEITSDDIATKVN